MEKQKTVLSKENRIFSLAKKGRYQPNVILAVLITIIILYGMDFLLILTPLWGLGRSIASKGLAGQAFAYAINGLAIRFGLYILAFFALVRLVERRPIYTMGFERKEISKKYFRGFILGVLMIFLCIIIFSILGTVTIDTSNSGVKGFNTLGGVLIVLIGWIIQGASEEIMVRGWLLPVVGVRHNVALGIFISSTLFGALHLQNANIGPLAMINLVLFGVFAALYVIWEGGLWGICALHSSWNWAQGNVFGFEVSGTLPVGGILIDFKPTSGSDFITGGLFGIEGGIVCSIVLALGIFTLIFLIKRR
ncbi:type II CAAX endopeptidase family protein [Wukongibacter baidiensis]|uniref:CPBP family intramembrane glutamic endopeptidase n=1 Tax=Wukongibacter baidiensis TaxID=1723361 RepID=UPI003D7FC382